MTFKVKFAWVWYGMIYSWNSSFTNHLRYRWYHYAFCKGRAKVFQPLMYLDEWKSNIRKILDKHPGQIIPSHGLQALLTMIETQQLQKIMAFLENEDVDQAITTLIQELNDLTKANSENLQLLTVGEIIPENKNISTRPNDQEETTNINEDAGEENDLSIQNRTPAIHTRTCIIALDIYYELHGTREEYTLLKDTPSKFEGAIRHRFKIENLSSSLYKHIRFDYREILKKNERKGMAQLKKQFEQIIKSPNIFGEDVVRRAKKIYLINFRQGRGG